MRRFLLSLCLVSVLVAPAFAEGAKNYGSTVCVKDMECPSNDSDPDKLMAQVAGCAGRYFGFKKDVFDFDRGLDYANCATVKGKQTFGSSPVAMVPHCCFEKTSGDRCQLHCEVLPTE